MMEESRLELALREAEEFILEDTPQKEEYTHGFSVGFRRKMRRLIGREKEYEPQWIRRVAGIVLLLAAFSGGVFLGTNEAARAEVSGWFVNQKGLTYGGIQGTDSGDWTEPDLVAAVGVDGTEGFVYASELADAQMLGMTVNNPEEAAAYMKQLKQEIERAKAENRPYLRYIPLYESDGVTVIGEFGVGLADQVWVEWKDAQGE